MRERLTGSLLIGYILFMMAFSLITLSKSHGQYIQNRVEKLPSFSYQTLDGKKFTEKELNASSRLMIVYFNPACDVCQEETKEIIRNMDYFKDIQIVMISPSTKEEIAQFSKSYNLSKFSQVTVLHDASDLFYKQFNAMGYPALYMFDQKKNLIGQFNTHADIEEIQEVFGPSVAKK